MISPAAMRRSTSACTSALDDASSWSAVGTKGETISTLAPNFAATFMKFVAVLWVISNSASIHGRKEPCGKPFIYGHLLHFGNLTDVSTGASPLLGRRKPDCLNSSIGSHAMPVTDELPPLAAQVVRTLGQTYDHRGRRPSMRKPPRCCTSSAISSPKSAVASDSPKLWSDLKRPSRWKASANQKIAPLHPSIETTRANFLRAPLVSSVSIPRQSRGL